ncbi:MAG: DUF2946 family protein [Pseudomonadota bacterium]|nr:DUF2946 family protein [Rubrivivax sp.]MCA3256930.1 DUF2946 family protein [Rubrivivax sp.]MCE2913409.1 DUF2946 family protein [Rubrivivax sp.]MCZ8032790.1 DUF2946 family protein [Rubrivivax sp.]
MARPASVRHRSPSRWTALLAALSVLLATLAPAVSHALAPRSAPDLDGRFEVCTTQGLRSVAARAVGGTEDLGSADGRSGPGSPAGADPAGLCAFCALGGSCGALPPGNLEAPVPARGPDRAAPVSGERPAAAGPRIAAQPRAPPAHC